MSVKRAALVACGAMTIVACSIGKPMPQVTTYVLDLPVDAAEHSMPRRPEVLRVGNVRVAAAFAGRALIYRLNDVQYTSDPYHAFMAEPGAMLGDRIAAWLGRVGPFRSVASPGGAGPAAYVLDATVS